MLNKLNNVKSDKLSLAKESINFEQKILKECVGSQDQIACSVGVINLIKFKKKGNFTVSSYDKSIDFKEKLNENLILLYTGQQRNAQEIAKKFINKITSIRKKK